MVSSSEYVALHEVPEPPSVPVGLNGRQLISILMQEYSFAKAFAFLGEVPFLQIVNYGQMKDPAFALEAVILRYQFTYVLHFIELV